MLPSKRPAPPGGYRIATGLVALWAVVGLHLASLPPGFFSHAGDECVMACSLEDRECCCKKLFPRRSGNHSHESAGSGPRLSAPQRPCAELSAVFDKARDGYKLLPIEARGELPAVADVDAAASLRAPARGLDHGDPSTLPRPPPFPASFC